LYKILIPKTILVQNEPLKKKMANKPTTRFVTTSPKIFREVKALVGDSVTLEVEDVDLPNFQGEIEDICREKCLFAAKQIKAPFLLEDTSLCFNALSGLPGPYVRCFIEKTGLLGLYTLLLPHMDKSAIAVCALGYVAADGSDPIVFIGKTLGTIVPPRESLSNIHFGWDPIFLPDGFRKTYAELDDSMRMQLTPRKKACEKLLLHVQNQ
jgi:inosine triphosphate pyrophosphatase